MPTSYDRIAPQYDRYLHPLEKWFLQDLRKETIAAIPKSGLILELGAGTGANFQHYQATTKVIGIEPSSEMLRIATPKARIESVFLVRSVGEYLPFPNECFDSALATLVLCSVQSPSIVFGELKRVVKTGGVISLLEHVRPDGLLGPLFDVLSPITVRMFDDHLNRRTTEIARTAGLEIMKIRKVGFGIINVITCKVPSSV